jgi:hypothetical protein
LEIDVPPTSLPMSHQRHEFLQQERQAHDYETHANADGHTVPTIGGQGRVGQRCNCDFRV